MRFYSAYDRHNYCQKIYRRYISVCKKLLEDKTMNVRNNYTTTFDSKDDKFSAFQIAEDDNIDDFPKESYQNSSKHSSWKNKKSNIVLADKKTTSLFIIYCCPFILKILDEKILSSGAFRLYIYCGFKIDYAKGFFEANFKDIAIDLGISERHVYTLFKMLEDKGLVLIKNEDKKSMFFCLLTLRWFFQNLPFMIMEIHVKS